jgi:hypothetical protein
MADTDVRAAKIAALAGVVGALVGGLVGGGAGYLSNLRLYESQRTDVTRGTARVIQQDLATAERIEVRYWQGLLAAFPRYFSQPVDRHDLQASASG